MMQNLQNQYTHCHLPLIRSKPTINMSLAVFTTSMRNYNLDETVIASHFTFPLTNLAYCHFGSRRRSWSCRCSVIPSHASVFTALRLNSSVLRIMGPGSATLGGIGKLLAMDEFFVQPVHHGREFSGRYQPEALTYFLEEQPEDSFEQGENPRHGIQVLFQTGREVAATGIATDGSAGSLFMASYVREAVRVPTVVLETGNGKGAAKVRVVAGEFAGLSSVIPSQDFVLLDVFMRPGSEANFTVNPCHGLLIYILEGVGIFKRNETSSQVDSFYENEGHGIWFPPWNGENTSDTFLNVLSHSWSGLRFLALGSPLE